MCVASAPRMAETCTCPHCGGELICVGTIGPSAEDYADLAFARCVRFGCGEAMILGGGQPGVPAWKIPAWRAERRRARWFRAIGTVTRAFTELWCLPASNVIERAVVLVLLEGCAHLMLLTLRRCAPHLRHPEAVVARLNAWHLHALLAPLVVCLVVGVLVTVVSTVSDALRVRRLSRGELRRAELRGARSDYR
jgi:hypothetical protein